MSLRNKGNQSILHQTLYLQGEKNKNLCYISDLTDNKGLYEFTSVHASEKIVPVLMIFW